MAAAPSPTPSLPWRVFALTGIGTMKFLSLSDTAWEKWEAAMPATPPRKAIRTMWASTVALHVAESVVVHRKASAAGLASPGRWAFNTLLYGFPVMRRVNAASHA